MPQGHAAAFSGPGHEFTSRGQAVTAAETNRGSERIYTSQQLVTALRSANAAIRDQLSVLAILDSTASSWPGMHAAADDLEQLVDIVARTTHRLEISVRERNIELDDVKADVVTLRETLALQQTGKDELQRESTRLRRELRAASGKLEERDKEVAAQKQELWGLERQRADLASELERLKQDNEFMEGEINGLRANVTEQLSQITALKEELAARRVDVTHLQQQTHDQKSQIEHLKGTLDSTSSQLRDTQVLASQAQASAKHHERECDRLHDENGRLAAELDKTTKELVRVKDWQEVVKKVEADKLREEKEAHAQERQQLEGEKAALDKALAAAQVALNAAEDRIKTATRESDTLRKQLAMAGVNLRGLQQDLAAAVADKALLVKQLEEARASASAAEANATKLAMQMAAADKAAAVTLAQVREIANADRARLQAAADDAAREASVQRALAEGWSRDLKEAQDALHAETTRAAGLQSRLDELLRSKEESKSAASTEGAVMSLRQQLEASQLDMRRMRAEHASEKMRIEKQLEALHRECNESAMEVSRLRAIPMERLSAMRQPVTFHDELGNLKRMLHSLSATSEVGQTSGGLGTTKLPAVQGSRQITHQPGSPGAPHGTRSPRAL